MTTTPTTTPTSGAAIQRYKIGYPAEEWSQRSRTPSGIPDASGSWVRYADHVNALAAGQATAAQGVAYAALPEYGINTASHAHFRVLGFTADQMRAFADATHTLRASHGQAPAGESLRTEALCDLSYSHGLKAGWNYCAIDDLAGFERAQKIGTEALRTLKSPTAQQAPAGATAWRSAVLDLIDECPGLTMEQDHWLSRRVKELDLAPAAQQAGAPCKCVGPRCMASSANGYAHSRECINEAAETQGWTPTANDYAKCGPSATGGEPAGTVGYTVHGTQYVNWRTKPPAHGTPLYTTPQPTQTQAVALPPTDEQIQEAEPLLDYAMQIAHERELRVTWNAHDEDGAKLRFEAAAMRHIATGAAQAADSVQEDAAREAIEKVLALFPFNVPIQKFTVNNGPCLTADNDDEFYSVKRVLAFLTEIKTTLDAARKQGGV